MMRNLFGDPVPIPPPEPDEPPPDPPAPEPKGDWKKWMPRLCEEEHRWAVLAPDTDIEVVAGRPVRLHYRSGWNLKKIAWLVADAIGWDDLRRQTDWRPLCAWLDDRICPHDVVLPVIRRLMERGVEPTSLMYFDNAVREQAGGVAPRRRRA